MISYGYDILNLIETPPPPGLQAVGMKLTLEDEPTTAIG